MNNILANYSLIEEVSIVVEPDKQSRSEISSKKYRKTLKQQKHLRVTIIIIIVIIIYEKIKFICMFLLEYLFLPPYKKIKKTSGWISSLQLDTREYRLQ